MHSMAWSGMARGMAQIEEGDGKLLIESRSFHPHCVKGNGADGGRGWEAADRSQGLSLALWSPVASTPIPPLQTRHSGPLRGHLSGWNRESVVSLQWRARWYGNARQFNTGERSWPGLTTKERVGSFDEGLISAGNPHYPAPVGGRLGQHKVYAVSRRAAGPQDVAAV